MKKMKTNAASKLPFLATAGFILLFSGCMLYEHVSTAPPAEIAFSHYHTYDWMDNPDSCDRIGNAMPIRDIAEGAVEQELTSRGCVFSSDQPDLLLRITVCNKKMEQLPAYLYPWSFSFLSPGLPGGQRLYGSQVFVHPSAGESKYDFLESTLTLFVYDGKESNLLWSSSVVQQIEDVSEAVSVTRKSVKALMEKYPVKPLPEKMATL